MHSNDMQRSLPHITFGFAGSLTRNLRSQHDSEVSRLHDCVMRRGGAHQPAHCLHWNNTLQVLLSYCTGTRRPRTTNTTLTLVKDHTRTAFTTPDVRGNSSDTCQELHQHCFDFSKTTLILKRLHCFHTAHLLHKDCTAPHQHCSYSKYHSTQRPH